MNHTPVLGICFFLYTDRRSGNLEACALRFHRFKGFAPSGPVCIAGGKLCLVSSTLSVRLGDTKRYEIGGQVLSILYAFGASNSASSWQRD